MRKDARGVIKCHIPDKINRARARAPVSPMATEVALRDTMRAVGELERRVDGVVTVMVGTPPLCAIGRQKTSENCELKRAIARIIP